MSETKPDMRGTKLFPGSRWIVDEEEDGDLLCESLDVLGSEILTIEERWDGPRIRVSDENARIIASAGLVLEALEGLVAILEDSGHDGDSPEIAVACTFAASLIARARGTEASR